MLSSKFRRKPGFPATLGYSVWGVYNDPGSTCRPETGRLETGSRSTLRRSRCVRGLLGCGGQLILFQCLRLGPAYIVFPIISLYPVVTVVLSVLILKETARPRTWIGIVLALIAIALLAYQPPAAITDGYVWLLLSMIVFLMWGLQAYIMKFASDSSREGHMRAESVTFYLMASAVVLMPIALLMTDLSQPINWGIRAACTLLQSSRHSTLWDFSSLPMPYNMARRSSSSL